MPGSRLEAFADDLPCNEACHWWLDLPTPHVATPVTQTPEPQQPAPPAMLQDDEFPTATTRAPHRRMSRRASLRRHKGAPPVPHAILNAAAKPLDPASPRPARTSLPGPDTLAARGGYPGEIPPDAAATAPGATPAIVTGAGESGQGWEQAALRVFQGLNDPVAPAPATPVRAPRHHRRNAR